MRLLNSLRFDLHRVIGSCIFIISIASYSQKRLEDMKAIDAAKKPSDYGFELTTDESLALLIPGIIVSSSCIFLGEYFAMKSKSGAHY